MKKTFYKVRRKDDEGGYMEHPIVEIDFAKFMGTTGDLTFGDRVDLISFLISFLSYKHKGTASILMYKEESPNLPDLYLYRTKNGEIGVSAGVPVYHKIIPNKVTNATCILTKKGSIWIKISDYKFIIESLAQSYPDYIKI